MALFLVACGPNDSELRAELRSIEDEMTRLAISANRYRAEMNEAEFATFIGSFAAGFGAVSGDYSMAGDGAYTAINASSQASAAGRSLEQIRDRHIQLAKRREEIRRKLK